jgi:mycothiol synthase
VNVRRPAEADFDEVLALMRAADEAVVPESDWTSATLREYWDDLDLARDAWIVELDGRIAGYADFEARADGRLLGDGYVHPELSNRGIGTELLRVTEERAAEELPRIEGPVVLQNAALLGDDCTPNLYARNGYEPVRHFWRMVVDLDAPPEPRVPEGVEVRPYRPEEARAVHAALEEAFADHWQHMERPFEEYAKRTFHRAGHDPGLYWVAREGGEIVGAALCDWKREGDWGWVGVIGVRPRWRRRGIAEALLHAAFAEFFQRGERRVGLGVDAESPTGATRLYERLGMRVFSRAVVYQKVLRAA